jgi:RNA polymerase primary sigma factor
VRQLRQYTRHPLSLDQTSGAEDDSPLGDLIEDAQAVVPVDAVVFVQLHDDLQSVLTTLSQREASIIRLRFGLTDGHPRTLDGIGRVYGLTRERIRQIEATTMTKLRQPSRCQLLRGYLN